MTRVGEDIRLQLPHIELAARLYGPPEGQPVIALHGWLDNANSFARLAPKLRGLRIVALDMAGHGRSQHRPLGASYALWDYAYDVLEVARQLEWARFSLLGHSLGAIVSVLLAAAQPQRIERLALIDGAVAPSEPGEQLAQRLGSALQAQLDWAAKRKSVFPEREHAIQARMRGLVAVSREAAHLLAARGLTAVPGGYTWSSDSRLTLPSPIRLTPTQALDFALAVQCPTVQVVAEEGLLANNRELLSQLPFVQRQLPGGHHLHLNDDVGAELVADCFNRFFAVP